MARFIDLKGKRFGRLIVVKFAGANNGALWLTKCKCGNEKTVKGTQLRSGGAKSCGCLLKENPHSVKHGGAMDGKRTPEYRTWNGIIERCSNPKSKGYCDYGGRGIAICNEWSKDFSAFLASVGNRPHPSMTIDRIENDRGYEPGNVRWATKREQARNRRNNTFVTIDGHRCLLVEACEKYGISRSIVRNRLTLGWSDEEALKTPPHSNAGRFNGDPIPSRRRA